jgi:hypothetical protein
MSEGKREIKERETKEKAHMTFPNVCDTLHCKPDEPIEYQEYALTHPLRFLDVEFHVLWTASRTSPLPKQAAQPAQHGARIQALLSRLKKLSSREEGILSGDLPGCICIDSCSLFTKRNSDGELCLLVNLY